MTKRKSVIKQRFDATPNMNSALYRQLHDTRTNPDGSTYEISGVMAWCHDCGCDVALMPGHPTDPKQPTYVLCRSCLNERARQASPAGASNARGQRT